jgi:hypothetical protein
MTEDGKLEFSCYKASIERLSDTNYRIYLFESLERGGDVEILIQGTLEIWKEIVSLNKSKSKFVKLEESK